jgi:hypothetical protein
LTLARGVLEVHDSRVRTGGFDLHEFVGSVRQFAREAHEVLSRPDRRAGQRIRLHGRVFYRLRGAAVSPAGGILPWLRAGRPRIGARLPCRSLEGLESRVACIRTMLSR